MSQSHEWRKISVVSPADMTQLAVFWITRQTLPRPVRRRAVEAGILHDGQPPLFTHEGQVWMLENAPRSRWSAPEADKRVTMNKVAITAAILAGGLQ